MGLKINALIKSIVPGDPYRALESAAIAAARANDAALWYIGRDLAGVFEDSAGNTPAVLGGPVGLLRDRQYGVGGMAGFHLSQATAAAKPMIITLASGLLGINFDGIDDHMPIAYRPMFAAGGSTLVYSHDASLIGNSSFLLAESNVSSNSQVYSLAGIAASGGDIGSFLRNDANVAQMSFLPVVASGRLGAGVTTVVDSGASILGVRNGSAGASVSYTRAGSYTFNRLTLCAAVRSSVLNWVGGRFGLVCSAPGVMPVSDRIAIERFAAYLVGVPYGI